MDTVKLWLLGLLDEAFAGPAWHGPSLSSAVRGLSAEQAAWRPAPGRHSAWEIVLHCAYWKHRVHERVAPGTAAPFPRTGSNWPDLPGQISSARWKADVALLKSVHAELREVVAALPPRILDQPAPRQKQTRRANLVGICYHDIYHAGQIRLLRKLLQRGGSNHEPQPAVGSAAAADSSSMRRQSTARRLPVARDAIANALASGGAS